MIDTGLMLTVLVHLLPVLYGVALFNYILVFVTNDATVRRMARPTLTVAVSVNFVYLAVYTVFFQHIPMVNVYQVLGCVAFAVATTYLWVESKTGTLHTGPFILGLVFVFQIVHSLFPKLDSDVPDILKSTLFSIHVSAAVLGYSAFAVAAVYGVLYLLQYRVIRNQSFGLVFRRLPSLDILDRMNFYAATAGFLLLTVAISVGALWSTKVFGQVHVDPKVLVAVATWALYGAALLARRYVTWRGPRMALSSVLGFVVVLFSMFAVNFFLTKFHVFVS